VPVRQACQDLTQSRAGLAGEEAGDEKPAELICRRAGAARSMGVMAERFDVSRDGITLAGERWPGGGPTVVLLHEGVADRRGWAEVAGLLAPELAVVAYDRRGYGQTPPGPGPFSHLDDLLAVLDHAGAGPVWLAGASAGAAWPSTPPWLSPAGSQGWW
jgi:alpha/beta hydrolase family protein